MAPMEGMSSFPDKRTCSAIRRHSSTVMEFLSFNRWSGRGRDAAGEPSNLPIFFILSYVSLDLEKSQKYTRSKNQFTTTCVMATINLPSPTPSFPPTSYLYIALSSNMVNLQGC